MTLNKRRKKAKIRLLYFRKQKILVIITLCQGYEKKLCVRVRAAWFINTALSLAVLWKSRGQAAAGDTGLFCQVQRQSNWKSLRTRDRTYLVGRRAVCWQ